MDKNTYAQVDEKKETTIMLPAEISSFRQSRGSTALPSALKQRSVHK